MKINVIFKNEKKEEINDEIISYEIINNYLKLYYGKNLNNFWGVELVEESKIKCINMDEIFMFEIDYGKETIKNVYRTDN